MKAHTFKDLVQMTMTGDEVFYLAEDVGSLIIRKNLLLNEKDARIAELEKALRRISELDCAYAATNGAAYDAVQIAKSVL